MKLLLNLGLLIAVSASPLPSVPNELPLIQQESEQNEVDERNAFILDTIRNELKAQAGNLDGQEINYDTLNVLNAIREILNNEVNEGNVSDNVKVQQIAKNNGLDYINEELEKNQNETLSDENFEANNAEQNVLLTPVNVLRNENFLNNEDDSDSKNANLEQTDDQYELKIAGFGPHIQNYESDSDESSDRQTENNSESVEINKSVNNVKRKFDNKFLRYPQVFQIRLPVEL